MTDSDWDWPQIVRELSDVAVGLSSMDSDDDLANLETVGNAVADATVIGLGEASHGTREFIQFRSRLIQYLVQDAGLRLIGLESNFAATLDINSYVVDGTGTAESALSQDAIHGTYQVQEMVAFLEWVRSFNDERPRPDRVRIHGFDVQHSSAAAERIVSFLERTDPRTLSQLRPHLERLANSGLPDFSDDEELQTALEDRRRVVSVLEDSFEDEAEYVRPNSRENVEHVRRLVWMLDQSRKQFRAIADGRAENGTNVRIRDSAMAAQVQWLLRHEGCEQIAIWGHNAHLTRGNFGGGTTRHKQGIPSMGYNLASLRGVTYVALGLILGGGSVTAAHVPDGRYREYDIDDPPRGTIPWVFNRVDTPILYLDVTDIPENSELARWLDSSPKQFDIVGGYRDSPVNLVETDLLSQFDGVVFIHGSSPTRPLSSAFER